MRRIWPEAIQPNINLKRAKGEEFWPCAEVCREQIHTVNFYKSCSLTQRKLFWQFIGIHPGTSGGQFSLHLKLLTLLYYLATKRIQWFGKTGIKTAIAKFDMLVSLQQWLHTVLLWKRNGTSFINKGLAKTCQNKETRSIWTSITQDTLLLLQYFPCSHFI